MKEEWWDREVEEAKRIASMMEAPCTCPNCEVAMKVGNLVWSLDQTRRVCSDCRKAEFVLRTLAGD